MRNSERKISPPPYVVGYGSLRRGALRVVFLPGLPLWSALAERSGDSAFGVRREAQPRFTRRSATPLWDAPEARGGLRWDRALKADHVAPLVPKRRRRYAL